MGAARKLDLAGGRDDRRRFRRLHVKLPIRELTPEQHVTYATSVSAGGLFCPDAAPRTPGAKALLEIDLMGVGEPLVVSARAVRVGDGAGFGVGWRFSQEHPELAELLDKLGAQDG